MGHYDSSYEHDEEIRIKEARVKHLKNIRKYIKDLPNEDLKFLFEKGEKILRNKRLIELLG